MPKITRGNVAAARARMEILQREGKEVPEIVQRLAALDIDNLDVLDRKETEKRPERRKGKVRNSKTGTSKKKYPFLGHGFEGTDGNLIRRVVRKDDATVVVEVTHRAAAARALKLSRQEQVTEK